MGIVSDSDDVSSSFFITVDGNIINTIDSVSTIDVDTGGAMDGIDIDVLQRVDECLPYFRWILDHVLQRIIKRKSHG